MPSPSIKHDAASERNIHVLAHLTRINEEMVNFLHKQSQDPLETYQQLRKFCGSALAAEVLEEDFDMTDLTSDLLQPDSRCGTSRDGGNELPVKRAIREKLLLWKGRASKKESSETKQDTDTVMSGI